MTVKVFDRVYETSTTTGTGTITLAGAVSGYDAFSDRYADGELCMYYISHQTSAEYEGGLGTYSAGTLARTTVLQSSNADTLVTLTAGTKDVIVTPVANSYDSSVQVAHSTRSIQSAVDALPSTGGKVIVLPGSYELTEPVLLPNDTILEIRAGAIVFCQDSYAPTLNHTVNGEPVFSIITNADAVGNSGIRICGEGRVHGDMASGLNEAVSWSGIHFNECTDCRVDGLEIDHIAYDVSVHGGTGGTHRFFCFLTTGCDDCHIWRSHCHHAGDDCISFRRTSINCSCCYCHAHDNKFGHGIQTGGSLDYVFGGTGIQRNILIHGNFVESGFEKDREESGISSHSSEECIVSNNRIRGTGTGVLMLGTSQNNKICDNYIEDCRWRGILIAGQDNQDVQEIDIDNNMIRMVTDGDSENSGIELEGRISNPFNVVLINVRGNTVVGNSFDANRGILLRTAAGRIIENVNIVGNSIYNCGLGAVDIEADGAGAIVRRISITGNIAIECGYHTISYSTAGGVAEDITVTGGVCKSTRNVGVTATGSRGVRINNTTNAIVTGVRAEVTGLSFSESGTADYNIFTSCNGRGSGTSTVTIVGANSVTANNIS